MEWIVGMRDNHQSCWIGMWWLMEWRQWIWSCVEWLNRECEIQHQHMWWMEWWTNLGCSLSHTQSRINTVMNEGGDNNIHWCGNRLDCYQCCSHTLHTIIHSHTVIVMKDRTVSQFDKHLITIKSHTSSSSSWWSVSNSHSYSTRNNHCHKQPHSKSHKKKKGEKDMEVWWMIVIDCGSVVQLGICDDFEKVWKHIGRQKQGIHGDGREKWCDTDRNDVKIRVVCWIYD